MTEQPEGWGWTEWEGCWWRSFEGKDQKFGLNMLNFKYVSDIQMTV